MLCLWLTLALLCFWLTEQSSLQPIAESVILSEGVADAESKGLRFSFEAPKNLRWFCYAFAACCALGVLTKGLIGVVFPVAIVLVHLLLTAARAPQSPASASSIRSRRSPSSSPSPRPGTSSSRWRIPRRAIPAGLTYAHGALSVPLPTQGNVHGWLWFYFVNEQLLRYLNLRVPRDYDTVPLWLFWGLCLVWLMPWSAFAFKAVAQRQSSSAVQAEAEQRIRWPIASSTLPIRKTGTSLASPLLISLGCVSPCSSSASPRGRSTTSFPRLPAARDPHRWLACARLSIGNPSRNRAKKIRRANLRATTVLVVLGSIFAAAALVFLLRSRAPAPSTDLASLLQQNPADYALSMGHFLDLNSQALALFRLPLALAAAALFLGPLCLVHPAQKDQPHAATLALAAGAFGFLLAAHLGLQIFAPVLSSQQLAAAIAPQLHSGDLIVIHQEYEFASTLGFYLRRPSYTQQNGQPVAINPIHILEGRNARTSGTAAFSPTPHRSSRRPQSLAEKWRGPQRIFLWQDLANQPSPLPALPGPVYIIAKSGGKEIVSNQPNRP